MPGQRTDENNREPDNDGEIMDALQYACFSHKSADDAGNDASDSEMMLTTTANAFLCTLIYIYI